MIEQRRVTECFRNRDDEQVAPRMKRSQGALCNSYGYSKGAACATALKINFACWPGSVRLDVRDLLQRNMGEKPRSLEARQVSPGVCRIDIHHGEHLAVSFDAHTIAHLEALHSVEEHSSPLPRTPGAVHPGSSCAPRKAERYFQFFPVSGAGVPGARSRDRR